MRIQPSTLYPFQKIGRESVGFFKVTLPLKKNKTWIVFQVASYGPPATFNPVAEPVSNWDGSLAWHLSRHNLRTKHGPKIMGPELFGHHTTRRFFQHVCSVSVFFVNIIWWNIYKYRIQNINTVEGHNLAKHLTEVDIGCHDKYHKMLTSEQC